MTTQKTFKRRVRARSAKTGESYTAARNQLQKPKRATAIDTEQLAGMSEEALRRGTGRPLDEWLAVLDAWDGAAHSHTEIARWLVSEHQVGSWWAQTVTVAYERARGKRALHEHASGFSISVTRTINRAQEVVRRAVVNDGDRARWLPDQPMTERATTRGGSARFDWPDPASRVIFTMDAKGPQKTLLALTHERLPDPAAADRLKSMWRERMTALKDLIEAG